MATPKNKDTPRITPKQYLEQERASLDQKHEYVDGDIFAMVGASPAHILISMSISSLLREQTKNSSCIAYASDLKVCTADNGMFAYPDITVVCGKLEFHDENKDVVTNPKVIVEVLSPSTEVYDRSEKFFRYQQIESFTDYILVAQDKARVEHLSRQQDGQWVIKVLNGLESTLTIKSINCTLKLSDIYDRVWEGVENKQ